MDGDATPAVPDCPHCRGGREFFRYWDDLFEYDVERAKELVRDGREPVEVEPESARASVEESRLDERHVAHVDPSYPGVIAHIWYPAPDGVVYQARVLIDGHHRAARCLAEGRPFRAYLLDEEESRAVLARGPEIPRAGALAPRGVPTAVAAATAAG